MKLTILGCNGPFSAKGGACSGYLFEHGDTALLADCGSGVLEKLMAHIEPSRLSAVLLSHLHFDHIADMPIFGYYMQFKDMLEPPAPAIPIFAPASPLTERGLLSSPYFALSNLFNGFNQSFGSISVTAFKATHSLETYALKFEANGTSIFYTADTRMSREIIAAAAGCRLLLCDAVLPQRLVTDKTPHMSALDAGELAHQCGCETLILTHLCPLIDSDEILKEAKSRFENTFLAASGSTYIV
ncbi:MAG: MBL fold metallo-hydrolase [Christensenellales bacterium]|jgi:ribonuclease BN (tRNA processing enzyme)